MADVKCPVCGQNNPPDAELCRNCFSPLHSVTESIQPGDAPTKKLTADLEPILPAWLREARDQSRQSAKEDLQDQAQTVSPTPPAPTTPSDLLAGLQSQAGDEDDEIPDWLTSLTGETGKKKTQPEAGEVHRVELGSSQEPAADKKASGDSSAFAKAEEGELPSWLSSLSAPQEPSSSGDDLSAWLNKAEAAPEPKPPLETETGFGALGAFTEPVNPSADEESSANWLNSLKADASALPESAASTESFGEVDLPAWLKADEPVAAPSADGGMPDWLKKMSADAAMPAPEAETPAAPPPEPEKPVPAPLADDGMPDWLKSMSAEAAMPAPEAETPAAPTPEPEISKPASFETLDWLKDMDAVETPAETAAPTATPSDALDIDLPDWLKSEDVKPAASEAVEADLPSWLGKPPASTPPAAATPLVVAFTDFPLDESSTIETPDWLSNLGSEPADKQSAPPLTPQGGQAVFTEELPGTNDLDSLFTDVPDWLSSVAPSAPAASEPPPAAAEETDASISPASLPSWVQAMRPVEASMTTPRGAVSGDETLETLGPLAGLHGVLPSAAYGGASSKPKAQSSKLQMDEEQEAHSALLDQILAAEARPEPMATSSQLASQRVLRISIGMLLFVVLAVGVFARTQFFPLPLLRPDETMAAFGVVDGIIPPDAPVLVVFDYEPSLAGEMETVAAPLLDHLIVKQHPRLALLSTSPTGSLLAARLLTGPLGDLQYQSGNQYVNLGYLPGGLSGVRAFAQDPLHTSLFASDVSIFNPSPASVWQSAPLQGVQAFSNFAAIIVITDSADAGRTWIEQAAPLRGSAQFVVVSSAQAGPMLEPYFESGQINGLVTGLYDGGVLEQNNANRPGLARLYWDAYNFGLILALVLLVGGALWNLVAGLRERTTAKEAG